MFFSWFLGKTFHINTDYLHNLLSKFPLVYSGLIYVLLYVVLSFFIWFAKDILRAAGALLFGAYLSALFVYLAEMINAVILFNLSRFLGRDFVENYFKGGLLNFDKKIEKIGFFGIFAFRIVPLVPFRALDITAGLTSISFKEYFLASLVGSPLRIFWLQFILAAVGLNVFKDINVMIEYFLNNKIIFIFSLAYLCAAIIAGVFLKNKFLRHNKGGQIK